MLKSWQLYRQLISIQIRSQMQYRVSFWLDIISTGLLDVSFFLAFALVIQKFGSIAGWSLGEVAFLAGMTELSFALMEAFFSGFDDSIFSTMVRMGTFDQILLRPVNITLQVLGSRFILRRLGRISEGLLVLLFGLYLNPIHWTPLKIVYLPVLCASQVFGMGALFILGATLTFWTMQPVEAVNIVTYGGNELMSYPMTIYPTWIQRFFTYVIPFMFLNYLPALYFLDKPDPYNFPPGVSFLAPFAAGVMMITALSVWRWGINHYQSSGS